MTIKKAAGYLHLYLGLIVGIVAVFSYLPAALYVWEAELTDWYYHERVFNDTLHEHALPLSQLLAHAQQALPAGQPLSSVMVSRNAHRAYIFTAYKGSGKPAHTFFGETEYWKNVYVDQYTGKVKGITDMRLNWIILLRYLHQQLLLDHHTGHLIVGSVTLAMFVLVSTGLVLWWPRNKAALKQRFKIKFSASGKRVNHDLHNVGGFYAHFLILLLAASGLPWTFDWWTNGIYRLLGNDPKAVYPTVPKPNVTTVDKPHPVDLMWQDLVTRRDTWENISLYWGATSAPVSGAVRYNSSSGWDTWDSYQYHPQSGAMYFSMKHEEKTLGAKWRGSNYAIHVGSIYGLPTKILASLASLFCASLPVTGFLIWYNRKPGKKKLQKKPVARYV
jgi:uncharacterized iron-regulated membrane protein